MTGANWEEVIQASEIQVRFKDLFWFRLSSIRFIYNQQKITDHPVRCVIF